MYERIWYVKRLSNSYNFVFKQSAFKKRDESDYVVPPAENSAFFVMTNVVVTPNQTRFLKRIRVNYRLCNVKSQLQTRGFCPEDPKEVPESICSYKNLSTGEV